MDKKIARESFEHTYELEKKYAEPNSVTSEYDRGVMNGIVRMAFISRIITQKEMKAYYDEINEIFYPKNKSCYDLKELKKAE